MIIIMLMGYAALGHFNRVSISVAGAEVFIQDEAPAAKDGTPAAAAPAITETGKPRPTFAKVFTSTQMGWVYTAFLVIYTASMMPGGWLIDRIGAGRSLTLLGLGMGFFVAMTGVLGWLMSSPHQFWIGLLVIRGLAGMCSAPLHPGAAHVVSDVASLRGRTTANGLVTAGALLGIAFSYPLFGQLMDRVTWQWAFVVSGLTLVAYGVLWSRVVVPHLPGPHAGKLDQEEAQEASAGIPWRVIMRKDIWLVTLSYIAYSYFQYLFFYWMTFYFDKVLLVSPEQSRRAAFLIALAQGAGMVIGGMSNDVICRVMGVAAGRRAIMMVSMILSAILAMIAVSVKDYADVVLFMALAMGAQGMCEGVYWTTATEIGGKFRGFAGAFMNCGGNIGGFISPVVTPMLAENPAIGWRGAIAVACVICALGGVIWIWIKPSKAP